jgi:GMP synthase (glutamine-hydrolysing)
MILIINLCKEKLHYFEFVKPIEDILKFQNISFFTRGYREIQDKDLENAKKVIICGTSLADNDFALSENSRFWKWITNFNKPLIGICGGMQILGLAFGGKIRKETEIGFFKENFEKDFFGLFGYQEVYHLHNYFIDFMQLGFDIYSISENNICQAVGHPSKPLYGVLFHPEVRQKELIVNFVKK